MKNKEFLFGTAVLMSVVIGAGVFGLPYAGAQSGFLLAAFFLFILTIVMIAIHLFYGEVVYKTKEGLQLPGYVGCYLGDKAKKFIGVFAVIGFYGSILIYVIIGGNFLRIILSPFFNVSLFLSHMIFFIVGSIVVYFGLRLVSGLNFLMNALLIFVVFLFFFTGLNRIDFDNFKIINLNNSFIIYGCVLYALLGLAAIPEVRRVIVSNDKKQYKKAIIWGTIMPAILYFVFVATIIGLTGKNTSEDAISGLVGILGNRVVYWGAVLGFLTTITSCFTLGLSMKEMYIRDFKVEKNLAWFITCFIPIILYLLGVHNFIVIIIIMGALISVVEGSAIILMYNKAIKPNKIARIAGYFIILIFITGFIYVISDILLKP